MKGILFASFGSTYDGARARDIDGTARAVFAAFPGALQAQAYTSSVVRRRLAERGVEVPSAAQALERMADAGCTEVTVQPGHFLPGEEYGKLLREASSQAHRFSGLRMGAPLLATPADLAEVVRIVEARFPQEDGRGIVLMGHGSETFSNAVYAALDYAFKETGRPDIHVGAVEGYPHLHNVAKMIGACGYTSLLLAPLMLVAGDHATNDMAGDGMDSWAQVLSMAGYGVSCHLEGLGALAPVREMFTSHALAALPISTVPAPAAR